MLNVAFAVACGSLLCAAAAAQDSIMAWTAPDHPYRLQLQLPAAPQGRVTLALDAQDLIDAAAKVSVDVTSIDTFAFERAVLVDPRRGVTVGHFALVHDGEPVPIDGSFQLYASGATSPWTRFGPADGIAVQQIDAPDSPGPALWVHSDKLTNRGLQQALSLQPQRLYLLSYAIYSDPIDNNIGVSLLDPHKRLFAEQHSSYYNKLTPRGQWTWQQVLYRPERRDVNLRISAAFTGRGAVANLTLQPVTLRLIADLPSATDRLDLYVMMRGGHRLPQPQALAILPSAPASTAATIAGAQAAPLNDDAVCIESQGLRAWTVAPHLPLRSSDLSATAPKQAAAGVARQRLARGEARTVLLAIQTGTPQAAVTAHCDLPLNTRIERLAPIPVYDDAYPAGKLLEHRLDALVPLDFAHLPPSDTGIHLLALTVQADADTAPGRVRGSWQVQVQVEGQSPRSLALPLEVTVLPAVVKPMRHFGTLFGGQHFATRYFAGRGPFTQDSITVAEFHGYSTQKLEPAMAVALSSPQDPDQRLAPIRDLARRYYQRMLDYSVLPQTPTLYSPYTYKVQPRSDSATPALVDWDFTAYDQAIDELVIARDMPWLVVFHSNGHLMDHFRLASGETYSIKAHDQDPRWRQVSRDDYYNLVADFFEALASHLDDKGVLDRAVYVVDESDPSTYEVIRDYVQAVRSRPHARRIKFAHTCYKTSLWTRRNDDGTPMMAGVFDLVMADNDELFNFYEPQWNARLDPSGKKQQWVYYVESDHLNLLWAGMSTIVTPLKLKQFGASGWYDWASFIWSLPYPKTEVVGPKFPSGPVVNPWVNPFYHHGPGVLSFFYPPDPRGPADQPTHLIIPSYRLALMRDGIQMRALLEIAESGVDDAGNPINVDAAQLARAKDRLRTLWADNPVQWYLSYRAYEDAQQALWDALGR